MEYSTYYHFRYLLPTHAQLIKTLHTSRHHISRYKANTHKQINTTTNRYKEEICK